MPWPKPTLLLPVLLATLLAGCATAPHSEVPAVANACRSISLPAKLGAQQRAQLADEIDAAPATAVWPGVLTDANRVEGDLRKCQEMP